MFDWEKSEERARERWENVTDFEVNQIRDFRESLGVDFNDERQAYYTVDKPVKGWCDLMVAWDNDFGSHLPFQMGWFGYGTEYEALDVAYNNAVELGLPLNYTTESGQRILM